MSTPTSNDGKVFIVGSQTYELGAHEVLPEAREGFEDVGEVGKAGRRAGHPARVWPERGIPVGIR